MRQLKITKLKVKKLVIGIFLLTNFLNNKEKWLKLRNKYKARIKEIKSARKTMDLQFKTHSNYNPLVSIIVPNYNHEKFLDQRLKSIYNQTYKNFEVILLDDLSTDGSVEILKKWQSKYSHNTRLFVNEVRGGSAFRAWAKGIKLAKGELIWIAEADDYCDLNLLETLVKPLADHIINASFCYSDFVDTNGKKFWTIVDYVGERFNSSFTDSGANLMANEFILNNIIPNSSSCVFRNVKGLQLLEDESWLSMRIAGDWLFYAEILRGGFLHYSTNTKNYFRRHVNSAIHLTEKTHQYYKEIVKTIEYIKTYHNVPPAILHKMYALYKDYYSSQVNDDKFETIFNLEKIKLIKKKPSILVANYGFISGGAETISIFLANELKKQNYTVIFLDIAHEKENIEVRKMLDVKIPIIQVNTVDMLTGFTKHLKIDIVQTTNGWVDTIISKVKEKYPKLYFICGLHGYYEAHSLEQNINLFKIDEIVNQVDKFIYTSEKNLLRFKELGLYDKAKFVKIANGLPLKEINPIERKSLKIPQDAIVLCLVSRAIPEKGWQEAVEVVKYINSQNLEKEVHLLLIGDGPENERLKTIELPNYIHLLGYKSNIRDYFAMSDFGFLPSKFKGESFSLVNIDCIISGKPIIVSDNTPEIRDLYSTKEGFAGFVFELEKKEDEDIIPIKQIGDKIITYIKDKSLYAKLLPIVNELKSKFTIENMVNSYVEEYNKVIKNTKPRILIVSHELSLAGSPMVALIMAKILEKNGINVEIASPIDGPLREEIEKYKIPCKVIDINNVENYYNYSLVIFLCCMLSEIVRRVSSLGIKTLFYIHEGKGLGNDDWQKHLSTIQFATMLFGGKYSFDSATKGGVVYNDARMLNYGIEDRAKLVNNEVKRKEKIVFTIFGSIELRKRQLDFFRAITMLDEKTREKCNFIILGSSMKNYTPSEKYYELLKNEIKDIPQVKIIQKVSPSELDKYYLDTDVAVCTSEDDPMPIVITESLMFSKAVIVSTNTGQKEFIQDGVNGFVFETYNILELAKKMKYLIDNPEIIPEIGKKGRKIYEENFPITRFEDNILSIIKENL